MRAVQGTPTHQREAEHSLAALSFFAMKCLISRHAPCWRRSRFQHKRTVFPCLTGFSGVCVWTAWWTMVGFCAQCAWQALCKVWNLAFTIITRDTRAQTHSHTLKIPRSSAAQSFDIEFEAQGDDEGEGGGSSV